MSRPLVSIVVPTYDRAGFVETAVMSVLEQEYDNVEVIALDDGSSDETPAVLERIAERVGDERFRWGRHDNVGQAETINRGFDMAGGELLGYLSSDDYLLPGALTTLVAAAEEHPDADVVYPDFLVVDESDAVTDRVETVQHTLADALRWSICIPGVGALMRRRCFERVGGWDSRYHFVPDFEWWLRCGDVRFLRVPVFAGAWRTHGGSITMNDFDVENVLARLDERLTMLGEVFARDDLPAAVRDVREQAYSAMLIEMGALLDQGHINAPDRRWGIEDRVASQTSERTRRVYEEGILWSRNMARFHEQRADAATYEIGQLRSTIETLEETARLATERADLLDARLREATAGREAADAELAVFRRAAARPLWLRAVRHAVPQAVRPRVGAAWHRVRRLRRG